MTLKPISWGHIFGFITRALLAVIVLVVLFIWLDFAASLAVGEWVFTGQPNFVYATLPDWSDDKE